MEVKDTEPSLIVVNAKIYTQDDTNPRVEAVAMCGSEIVAVGSTDEIQRLSGPSTKTVDVCGNTVLPGFVDSHIHFLSFALRAQRVNLDGAASLAEALERVEAQVSKTRKGEWITGGGWDKNVWEGGDFPHKRHLDQVSPDNPTALRSKDGHCLWINSKALAEASITPGTPNPRGGEIMKDTLTGEATGILKEKAVEIVDSIIPKPTREAVEEALKEAVKIAHTFGITSIHVPEGRDTLLAFQRLLSQNELWLRVFAMLPIDALESAIHLGLTTGFGNQKLRVGAMKLFADGALGSQTAAMLEPYEGAPANRGIMVTTRERIKQQIISSVSHGFSVAVHAIGDRANRTVIHIFDEIPVRNLSDGAPSRIEHAQHLTEEDVARIGALPVIVSVQPLHIAIDMDTAERYLGARCRWAYPLRSLLDAGARLTFGSDCPVVDLDPILGIYTAVTRKRTEGYPSNGWYPEERISVEEAVKAYTIGAAQASGEEKLKGSIQVGKLADLVVLSDNIFEVPEDHIQNVQVTMTIFDGDIVYTRNNL